MATDSQGRTIGSQGSFTGGSSSGSSSSSSGGGSSGGSSGLVGGGSYNPSTGTYTSPSGEKQSMSQKYIPAGTSIDFSGGGSSGGGSGGSYSPSTGTYTSPSGQKQSMAQSLIPSGTTISSPTAQTLKPYEIKTSTDKKDYSTGKETYISGMNLYGSTATGVPDISKSTMSMRPPTLSEQKVIDLAQYKGDLYGEAITGIPEQMLGGIFTTKITDKEWDKLDSFKGYFNPKTQFDIFKGSFDAKRDLKQAEKVSVRLENLNKNFEQKEKTMASTLKTLESSNVKSGEWTGSETSLNKYNKLVDKYNNEYGTYTTKFEGISSNEFYQRALNSPKRKDIFQRIAKTNFSPTKKAILSGVVGFADLGSYLVPQVRVIRGLDILSKGGVETIRATTPIGATIGLSKTALGGIIVKSGFGGKSTTSSLFKFPSKWGITSKILGTTTKIASKTLSWGVPAGISGLYGYNIYKETKSLPVSIGAGIGGFVGFKSPEIVGGSIRLGKGFARQQKFLLSDKKAQQLLTTQKKGEWIYDYVKGKWVRKKSSMSRFEALGEFGRASSGRQIKILKTAFSLGEGGAKKVYLDKISLQKDIFKATKFMKDAGLTKMQIESRLTTLFPSFFKPITISSSGGMVIEKTATKVKNPFAQISESRFTKLSPIISNKLKPITASASSSLIFENQFGRLKTLSQNKVLTKNKQKTLTIQLPAFLSETKQRSGIASISAFNTAMKTRQKEKLVFQPKLVQPSSLFEKPSYRITPERPGKFNKPKKNIPFIPPFIPFKFPTIGKSKGIGKVSISRKYQYTPSYTAKIFGITGKKTKAIRLPSGREVYTGLSIRKIIGKPKKTKKKSDKKTKKKKVKYKKKKKH